MPVTPNYPSSLDNATTLPEPTSSDDLDTVGVEHPELEAAQSRVIRALELLVGIPNSADPASLDRILKVLHQHDGTDSHQVDFGDLSAIPTTFTPASHTDTSHSDGPNLKTALVDAEGDLLVATAADVIGRLGLGSAGQVLTASASAPKVRWSTPAAGGGTATPAQLADFIVYKKTGVWHGYDTRTQADLTTNADFATVVNTCSATFVDVDSGQTLNDGGSIFIARPTNAQREGGVNGGILVTTPILMRTGMTLFGAGKSTRLIGSGAGMVNVAVINARDKNRYIVDNFAIDCASIVGSSGIVANPSDSGVDPDTGGPNSYSIISRLDISNFAPDPTYPLAANLTDTDPRRGGEGIGIGLWGDTGATANTWVTQNHVYGGGAGSVICGIHVGDVQIFWNNFHHISTTGYGIIVDAGGVHIKLNHVAQAGVGSPHGNIYLNSGPNTKILGNYLDNVVDGPAVLIKPPTSMSVGAPQIIGNWSNGTMSTDAVTPFVKIDVSGGNTANGVVMDNVGEGADATNRYKSIVEMQSLGANETYFKVANNKFRYTKQVYTGRKPFDLGRNDIQTDSNNDTNLILEDHPGVTLEDTVVWDDTDVEQELLGLVVPENTLDVGGTYVYELYGNTDNIATSGDFEWRVKLGGTIIAKVTFPSEGSAATTKEWTLRGMLTCQTKGAGGQVAAGLEVRSDFAADTKMNSDVAAIDTTADRRLSVAFDFDTADPGNVVRAKLGYIRPIKVAN